jgi:hypothetical protein
MEWGQPTQDHPHSILSLWSGEQWVVVIEDLSAVVNNTIYNMLDRSDMLLHLVPGQAEMKALARVALRLGVQDRMECIHPWKTAVYSHQIWVVKFVHCLCLPRETCPQLFVYQP